MTKPRVFIGSSQAGLPIAEAIGLELQSDADAVRWNQGIFGLSDTNIESLERELSRSDFAVLVMTADDAMQIAEAHIAESHRNPATASAASSSAGSVQVMKPRDNVVFELGLFMGRLGRQRTFFVYNNDQPPLIMSDLHGVTAALYHGKEVEKRNLEDRRHSVSGACSQIRDAIKQSGVYPARLLDEEAYRDAFRELLQRIPSSTEKAYHTLLYSAIARRIQQTWAQSADDWIRGEFESEHDYLAILTNVYATAKESIFSTSLPQYMSVWTSLYGLAPLEAQEKNNRAKSTRVFVFNKREEVNDEHRSVFKIHRGRRIEVLLYFNDEDEQFNFDPQIGNDWTCIDGGKIIGVTREYGDRLRATWYSDNNEMAARFEDYIQKLRDASVVPE